MSTDAFVGPAPLQVAIVGTGDGGMPNGVMAKTPDHLPNVIVRVVTPLAAIVVRFINLYLVTLTGLITAGAFGALPLGDFTHSLRVAALASLVPAAIGFIKDCATVFGNLERKFPLLTGSV